ncbi:MAG: hypothetical protein JXM68_07510, partial [Sedimentisphaerales bacterium]|nr:hypothetical protein [Sedimentisphaerales bacterium]
FNKALTDNEIAAIYNAGSGINRTVAYDNAGNLIRDGKGYMYNWDTENRLKAISKQTYAGLTVKVAEMEYDALGRRIRQVRYNNGAFASQSDYYYNGWQVLTEVVTDTDLEVSAVHYAYGNALDERGK